MSFVRQTCYTVFLNEKIRQTGAAAKEAMLVQWKWLSLWKRKALWAIFQMFNIKPKVHSQGSRWPHPPSENRAYDCLARSCDLLNRVDIDSAIKPDRSCNIKGWRWSGTNLSLRFGFEFLSMSPTISLTLGSIEITCQSTVLTASTKSLLLVSW